MNDEAKIQVALATHNEFVVEQRLTPVMTVLVGSQNYDLATEKSDYDTFTFVLPPFQDIAQLRNPISTTWSDSLGHINVKDIRLALNLLLKTTPNSVECFATKYKMYNKRYAYLSSLPSCILRCDTKHMMDAIGGMTHQLKKRNMSPGKRLSHVLRMHCMVYNYFHPDTNILSLTKEEHDLALKAKMDPDNEKWNNLIDEYERIVQEEIKCVDVHYFDKEAVFGRSIINGLQGMFTYDAVR